LTFFHQSSRDPHILKRIRILNPLDPGPVWKADLATPITILRDATATNLGRHTMHASGFASLITATSTGHSTRPASGTAGIDHCTAAPAAVFQVKQVRGG
jgi:hypothetical protein